MRRLIFTLLYDRGQFMLSRNFRLQAVGGIEWLFDNYDFALVSQALDELMVLDVSRGPRDHDRFAEAVQTITTRCFIPATVGGGITSFGVAQRYLRSGADKLLVNSAFASDPAFCRQLAARYGRQCIVAGVDYRRGANGQRSIAVGNGVREVATSLPTWIDAVQENGAGEILFQSIDQDGTGMGLDLDVVNDLPHAPTVPCIVMGGVGKADHVVAGIRQSSIDAVATANLFNFIGETFLDVRRSIAAVGVNLPAWNRTDFERLAGRFANSNVDD